MSYRWVKSFICLLALLPALGKVSAQPLKSVTIASPVQDLGNFKAIIERGDCLTQPAIIDASMRRNKLETLIICRALRIIDPDLKIKLANSANYTRNMRMVIEGTADIASESLWSMDASTDDFYVSSAVVREGQFEKGIYTRMDHPMRNIKPENLKLKYYHGVMVKNWVHDWNLVNRLSVKVSGAMDTFSAYKIINAGRADYTLAEFPANKELITTCEDESLYPVPGVKVLLPGTRHYVVNKSPKGKQIIEILNQGLEALHNRGEIDNLYRQIGFISNRTTQWAVLRTPEESMIANQK